MDQPAPSIRIAKIEQELELGVTADVLFQALTQDIGRWWTHTTYGADGRPPQLIIEPKLGGAFREDSGESGRCYGVVTRIEPGVRIWLEGAMGMKGCVAGWVAFELEPRGERTVLRLSHHVMGDLDQEMIDEYGSGWTALLGGTLKAYVEDGIDASGAA